MELVASIFQRDGLIDYKDFISRLKGQSVTIKQVFLSLYPISLADKNMFWCTTHAIYVLALCMEGFVQPANDNVCLFVCLFFSPRNRRNRRQTNRRFCRRSNGNVAHAAVSRSSFSSKLPRTSTGYVRLSTFFAVK